MAMEDHTPTGADRERRLRDGLVLWLTTVRPDGRPHIVPVWYLWDGAAFWVLSQVETVKTANLRQNHRVSFALDGSDDGHAPVFGDGLATLLDGAPEGLLPEAHWAKFAGEIKRLEWSRDDILESFRQVIRIDGVRWVEF